MDATQANPCTELRELVTEYLEEVMTGEELAWFETHVDQCGSCDVHVREVKAFIGLLAKCGPEPISEERRTVLHGIFRTWRQEIISRQASGTD